ncbi:MAG: hypothetical protein QW358_05185 [Candidatus Hadarchaeum sp.]
MAKTHRQVEEGILEKLEKRRKFLMEFPEVYQCDFDAAFKKYLQRIFPDVDLEDCDLLFDPFYRESFCSDWPEEALVLSEKYNLLQVWDPDGEAPPEPVEGCAARIIRCQEERIGAKQMTRSSIVNLPPHKTFGRFLLMEIDLSQPRREIEAKVIAIVDQKKKKLEISGDTRELVRSPAPRDRSGSFLFREMEIFKMVHLRMRESRLTENAILTAIAKEMCMDEGWDRTYGDFHDDPDSVDRVTAKRKAIKNSYERDKKLYFGK